MGRIRFGIVGSGWRSDFYLRIARELPERFQVSGIVVRDEEKGKNIQNIWGVPTYRSISSMMKQSDLSFVVTSVPWAANPAVLEELVSTGIPVLSETPPAPDLEGLVRLYEKFKNSPIQVAEQYPFQPLHAARIALARSGKLGIISQVQLSVAHGYHGICLLRKLLNITFENAVIQANRFVFPLVKGPDRSGMPQEEKVVQSDQVIASLDFKDKLGIYDFSGDQYFSWIRSPRLLVRGEKGEIHNREVRYLHDFRTPIHLELQRQNAGEDGNLEGYYHKGILAGESWIYRNPFAPGRLTDDEIAIATCLEKMSHYVDGGPDFYSLAEASQDHYLNLMIQDSLKTGEQVKTQTQIWAEI